MKHIFYPVIFLITFCTYSCVSTNGNNKSMTDSFITRDNTGFVKEGKPYRYIGTNLWYASILGSTGEGGDRARLCKELDRLKEIGVTNLRILSGPDAGSLLANPANPWDSDRIRPHK